MTLCELCNEPVNPADRYVFTRVVGWERKALGATRKSGSDIVLRESRDEYAHSHCVHKAKLGVGPGQESMVL